MNQKLTFLAVLAVIVTMFAVTGMVLADDLLPVTLSGEWEVYVNDIAPTLTVSAEEGAAIQWYVDTDSDSKDGTPIDGANQVTYTVNTSAENVGVNFYYAIVNGKASEAKKVGVSVKSVEPIIFRFDNQGAIDKHIANTGTATFELAVDAETQKNVLKLTSISGDCFVRVRELNVPLDTYKFVAYKIKPGSDMGAKGVFMHHGYNRTEAIDRNGAIAYDPDNWGFFGSALVSPNGVMETNKWQFVVSDNLVSPKDKIYIVFPDWDTSEKTYYGGRFDFINNAAGPGEVMYVEYIAFFDSKESFEAYKNAGEEITQPDMDMKAMEFKNKPSFALDFFPNNSDAVTNEGVQFKADQEYVAALMSRNKFDLDTYSVVKVLGAQSGTLTFINNGEEIGTVDLEEGVADFTGKENWTGEFVDLKIKTSEDVTITSIAFLKSKSDAAKYVGELKETEGGDGASEIKYTDAKWWSFEDSHTYYNVVPVNATSKFVSDTHSSYTVKQDGNVSLSYRDVNMKSLHKFETSSNPFIRISYKYNSKNFNDAKAYIKFSTAYRPGEIIEVNFNLKDWTTVNPEGFDMLALDFSSFASINLIDTENDISGEFRGEIESFEFGIVDAKADEVLDVKCIVFFEEKAKANVFDGEVMFPPVALITGAWAPQDVIKNEYITIDELDTTEETVEFNIADYSRISRLTLNKLKKEHPNTTVDIIGDGYRYQFNSNLVKNELKTWYYDLDAYFAPGFSGDVYRDTVKGLIAEDEYITGIHFVHKFMKSTDFPFNGKMIVDVAEDYEGKCIDIYKYNPATNTVAIVERAIVKDGKLEITELGGDMALAYSGYQLSQEEIERTAAIKAYQNTIWEGLIHDFSKDGDATMSFDANNAIVETKSEDGVTYKRATTNSTNRMETVFKPVSSFETSEYPVVVVKYRTSSNMSGSASNYVSTDFYTSDSSRGYEWYTEAAYYNAGGAYHKSTKWTTKVINYTDRAGMSSSGITVSEEWIDKEGAKRNGGQAFPFKGKLNYYRLDFAPGAAGVSFDVAYIAFFKTADEANRYVEARELAEKYLNEDVAASADAK